MWLLLGIGVGINKSVPVYISLSEKGATDFVPVSLGVLDAGSCCRGLLSTNWPSGLSDDDLLAFRSAFGDGQCIPEKGRSVLDAIGLGGLEVWEGVHAEEINRLNDGGVGTVLPCSPRIDVSDGDLGQRGSGNCCTNLLDIAGEFCGSGSDTERVVFQSGGGDSVQIFTSYRDTVDPAGELLSVLCDGILQSSDLVVDDLGTGRSPHSQHELDVLVNRGGNGRDGIVG